MAEGARGVSEAAVQPRGLVGTDGAFAELNRERPTVGEGETVVFTISPQVHDTDDEVVLDNLFGMRAVLESAWCLYPDRTIGIGLLELTPHFNPAAGDRATNASYRPVDNRLQEGFALAWAFAALCELSAAGVDFVTIFDDSGPHGFVGQDGLVPAVRLLHDVASRTPVTVALPPHASVRSVGTRCSATATVATVTDRGQATPRGEPRRVGVGYERPLASRAWRSRDRRRTMACSPHKRDAQPVSVPTRQTRIITNGW